jgi:proteasome lid subunit RPN8/RPN11
MERHTENAGATWTTPRCPFTIEYVPRVLDDIRLAVMDAFFSLPRGGAEIGGILLGSHGGGRVTIAGYQALDCEHAFGPGFQLSARDKALLSEMMAAERPVNLRPVGWYHSHTRSEIVLSDADLEIHSGYFPEPWQVALVIKPHTFQPARAGFFFREAEGEMHRSASYLEFQLKPLPLRPAPAAAPLAERYGPRPESRETAARAGSGPPPRVITLAAEAAVEPAAPFPESAPAVAIAKPDAGPAPEPDIPAFLRPAPERSRRWPKIVALIAAALAIGSAAYVTRQAWLLQLAAGLERLKGGFAGEAPQAPAAAIGLSVLDNDGQLQIRWDRNSATVRNGGGALLEILDTGSAPRAIPLDQAHLQSGSFTYAREGERVDVVLAIEQPNGKAARESTTFLGKPPFKPEDAAALRKQNAKLESDLKAANDRNRRLEKSLSDVRTLLRNQQRQRLENQIPK